MCLALDSSTGDTDGIQGFVVSPRDQGLYAARGRLREG